MCTKKFWRIGDVVCNKKHLQREASDTNTPSQFVKCSYPSDHEFHFDMQTISKKKNADRIFRLKNACILIWN